MKLFTCTDHDYHWPVGVASVVIATDEEQARMLLDIELQKYSLKPFKDSPYTLQSYNLEQTFAIVLNTGEY